MRVRHGRLQDMVTVVFQHRHLRAVHRLLSVLNSFGLLRKQMIVSMVQLFSYRPTINPR